MRTISKLKFYPDTVKDESVNCSVVSDSLWPHQAPLSMGFPRARILEWVAISFSRGSSRPRDRTRVSCIGGRCFNLWATRACSSKNLQTIHADKGVEKREPSYAVGGNVHWYNHYGEQYRDSLRKLKTELPFDATIPLLGIYLKKTIIWTHTCTPVFIAALLIIVKTWEQPKRPSTDECIKKKWYT